VLIIYNVALKYIAVSEGKTWVYTVFVLSGLTASLKISLMVIFVLPLLLLVFEKGFRFDKINFKKLLVCGCVFCLAFLAGNYFNLPYLKS